MSLRTNLPEIKALNPIPNGEWEAPSEALARWPHVEAALNDDSATITILDVIGQDPWTGEGVTTKRITAALRSIGARDVTVQINSPGGDFFEGLSIYNALRAHPHKVTVQVLGLAASAASVIAMAGDEVQVARAGFLMIHNAWAIALGNRHAMRATADVLEPFDKAMADVYAARTGMKESEIAKMMDNETWISGSDAVDQGFADSLLTADQEPKQTSADASNNRIVALRKVEAALASQKVSRRERGRLLAEIRGERDAAPNAMRDAGAFPAAALQQLIQTIRS